MLSFLKVFARGIIVTLLLPIIVLVLALYMVYCLVLFVVMFFKGVINWFKGGNTGTDLPEDLEARRIVLEKEKTDAQAKDMLNIMYQNMAQAAMAGQGMPQPQPAPAPAPAPVEEQPVSNPGEGENR